MTNDSSSTIVSKVWNYAHVLKNAGVGYGDYVEQITYLLFLKMDDEQARIGGRASAIPAGYGWATLRHLEGEELEDHYRKILTKLGAEVERASGVVIVKAEKIDSKNPLSDSKYRVFGKIFNDDMVIKWLQGYRYEVK